MTPLAPRPSAISLMRDAMSVSSLKSRNTSAPSVVASFFFASPLSITIGLIPIALFNNQHFFFFSFSSLLQQYPFRAPTTSSTKYTQATPTKNIPRQLHPLNPHSPRPTRKNNPIARLKPALPQRTMHSRSRTHNGSRRLIRHFIRNFRRINRRRDNILLIGTRRHHSRVNHLKTILFFAVPALCAVVAHVPHGSYACSVADFPVGYAGA